MRVRFRVTAVGLMVVSLAFHAGTAAEQQQAKSGVNAAELDGLLAPIALYPDPLLAQMLLCAGDPAKVAELNTWLAANSTLTGTALQDAATVKGFEPHFVAMTLFPKVIKFMAEEKDWTAKVGKAFAADRSGVFSSIQRLRKNAHQAGALKTTPQQEIETKTTASGEQVIVIEPANPQVVYVPQYSPQVVYTQPPPTTVVIEDDDDDEAVAGLIGFTAGIAIGAAIDNDYYYGPYGWGGGAYMYNDAWNDWYDHREDAREDWMDHREDLVEERGERTGEARGERTERQQTRQENRPTTQEREQRRSDAQAAGTTGTRATGSSTYQARGHGGTEASARERSGTTSDAFSGYSSGQSQRAASARGQSSRSRAGGSRGGGGRRR